MTITAPPPQRSTASFTLACGMLAIDLAVYSGSEETRVTRHEYVDGDPDRPAGRAAIDKTTGELIDPVRLVKLATATSGALVPVDDEQLRLGTLPTGVCEVVCFVRDSDVGYYVTEGVYQVRPKGTGTGKDKRANVAADKAFAVLIAGMSQAHVTALVRYALRGPARYGLLTCEGDLYPVLTHDQVRARRALPDTLNVTPAEMGMAVDLIDAIGIDTPMLRDETSTMVQTLVDALAVGIEPPPERAAPVIVDVMAAFNASIDAAKAARNKAMAL